MSVVSAVSTLDVLLSRAGATKGGLPTFLPRLSRSHLPALCRDLGFTKGAEIGVWKGAFSAAFCEANHALHMLCVDPWVSYPAWVDTKNATADPTRFMATSYREAVERLAPLNCTIVRQFSADAAQDVPDGSLDFVFLDGNHSRESVLQDLELWSPKVRSSGFVAGHDYRAFNNKPFIHVIEAVQEYTKTHRIDPWFVLSADRTPSFLWVQH